MANCSSSLTPTKRSRNFQAPNTLAKEREKLFDELKGYYDFEITDKNYQESYSIAEKELEKIKARVGAAGAAAEIQRMIFAKLDEIARKDAEAVAAMFNGGRRKHRSRKHRSRKHRSRKHRSRRGPN